MDENYYLLTLAAIAKEIAYRNAPTATPVILAAGLPLTSFGREKKAFRAYLLREGKQILDVCAICGFTNSKHFSTVFKKQFGVSPSKF